MWAKLGCFGEGGSARGRAAFSTPVVVESTGGWETFADVDLGCVEVPEAGHSVISDEESEGGAEARVVLTLQSDREEQDINSGAFSASCSDGPLLRRGKEERKVEGREVVVGGTEGERRPGALSGR